MFSDTLPKIALVMFSWKLNLFFSVASVLIIASHLLRGRSFCVTYWGWPLQVHQNELLKEKSEPKTSVSVFVSITALQNWRQWEEMRVLLFILYDFCHFLENYNPHRLPCGLITGKQRKHTVLVSKYSCFIKGSVWNISGTIVQVLYLQLISAVKHEV